jgi:hypothetical protein
LDQYGVKLGSFACLTGRNFNLPKTIAMKSRIRMKIETGMRRLRHNILAGPAAAEHALPHGRTRSRAGFNSRRSIQGEGDCH